MTITINNLPPVLDDEVLWMLVMLVEVSPETNLDGLRIQSQIREAQNKEVKITENHHCLSTYM